MRMASLKKIGDRRSITMIRGDFREAHHSHVAEKGIGVFESTQPSRRFGLELIYIDGHSHSVAKPSFHNLNRPFYQAVSERI